MPLHNWSNVESGIFHAFHTAWITEIQNALNTGLLPSSYYALAEQHSGDYVADVLTLHSPPTPEELTRLNAEEPASGGTAVAEAPPMITVHEKVEMEIAEMQRFLSIRHLSSHRVVAILEIVSPGHKYNHARYKAFIHKTVRAIRRRVSVLLVDVHETGRFDRDGINACIRNRVAPHATSITDKPRHSTLASYRPDPLRAIDIYLEHVAPDAPLPDMPIFLNPERYVNVPLEATYLEAWKGMPSFWRNVVLGKPVG